jgi:hypothetical protein
MRFPLKVLLNLVSQPAWLIQRDIPVFREQIPMNKPAPSHVVDGQGSTTGMIALIAP